MLKSGSAQAISLVSGTFKINSDSAFGVYIQPISCQKCRAAKLGALTLQRDIEREHEGHSVR